MLRISEMIQLGQEKLLEKLGDRAFFESRLLAAKATGFEIEQLILRSEESVSEVQLNLFNNFIDRRLQSEPMAYILEEKEFFKRKFQVGPGVLIPRPETELLVELTLSWMAEKATALRVAELGLGSGCLLFSIALERQDFKDEFYGWENSPEAINYAKKNQKRWSLDQVKIFEADFSEIQNQRDFDVILSNPPYIPSSELSQLAPEIQVYEPRRALDGGEMGLEFYRKIYQEAWPKLRSGGLLGLETHNEKQRELLLRDIFVSHVKKHWIEDCHLLIEKKD